MIGASKKPIAMPMHKNAACHKNFSDFRINIPSFLFQPVVASPRNPVDQLRHPHAAIDFHELPYPLHAERGGDPTGGRFCGRMSQTASGGQASQRRTACRRPHPRERGPPPSGRGAGRSRRSTPRAPPPGRSCRPHPPSPKPCSHAYITRGSSRIIRSAGKSAQTNGRRSCRLVPISVIPRLLSDFGPFSATFLS